MKGVSSWNPKGLAAGILLKQSECHSLDYITTQQKFPKAKWQAEVTKMIKVYGAPISEENSKIIADYISTHYGTGG
jgi:hypothetical protein